MGELSTAVFHKRDVKVVFLNNDAFGEVKFEQRDIGNPEYGNELGHIDFTGYAWAVGAQGFRVTELDELKPSIRAWLAAPGVAVLDVQVDPEEEAETPDKISA